MEQNCNFSGVAGKRADTEKIIDANDTQFEEVLERIKKIEQEFAERVHLHEYLLDTFEVPVTITDIDKKILFINRVGLSLLGKNREDVLGKQCNLIWNVDICKDKRCGVERLKRGEKIRSEFQIDNAIYTSIARFLKDVSGNKIGHVEVMTNITDTKKQKKQMLQSEALHRAKDKIFSVVSHDIRGTIANLLSVLRIIIESDESNDIKTELLKDATEQLEKNFEMVDNLLRWAKTQMQGIVAISSFFDIQEESLAVTDRLQKMAINKQISLVNLIAKQNVFIDLDMFNVILRNLTYNALKYTSSGGSVTLTSEVEDKMIVIAVKDTGTGMSPEVIKNIFKTSKISSVIGTNDEMGTGLGLILSAEFVKNIGGKIWFTSELGKGSTFYFSIPITDRK